MQNGTCHNPSGIFDEHQAPSKHLPILRVQVGNNYSSKSDSNFDNRH